MDQVSLLYHEPVRVAFAAVRARELDVVRFSHRRVEAVRDRDQHLKQVIRVDHPGAVTLGDGGLDLTPFLVPGVMRVSVG